MDSDSSVLLVDCCLSFLGLRKILRELGINPLRADDKTSGEGVMAPRNCG
jgi:hypothetical protein